METMYQIERFGWDISEFENPTDWIKELMTLRKPPRKIIGSLRTMWANISVLGEKEARIDEDSDVSEEEKSSEEEREEPTVPSVSLVQIISS